MVGQRGLITRAQATEAGMSAGQIDRRIRRGQWTRIAPQTFRVAGVPTDWRDLALGACLAGHGGLASHRTATALFGIGSPHRLPEVTVEYGRNARSSTALIHRARVDPIDRTTLDGVPTTTLARALVDCAEVLGGGALRTRVDSAMHEHSWLTARAVEVAWERAQHRPGRRGWANLDAALDDWRLPIRPGSPAELRLIRLVTSWGFPEPLRQVPVVDATGQTIARLDVGWVRRRLGLEYDSERWHGPTRWAADEARSRAVEAAGWNLLHADKLDLRPGASRLRRVLERAWSADGHLAA